MTEHKRRDRSAAADEPQASAPPSDAGDVAAQDAVATNDVAVEMDELRGELEAMNDRHLRLAAEFDNYRKRNERERQLMAARLQADLVSGLLDVIDDLQRVEETGPRTTVDSLAEGVRLVEKKFVSVLESAGLERVQALGQPFDPEVMEALMAIPTDDPAEDGRVADVLQPGYRFRDVLIRPARVRVHQYDESAEGSG